jgi:ApaG protein
LKIRTPATAATPATIPWGMSAATTIAPKHGSTVDTAGWRVIVEPAYCPEKSDADARRFVFTYRIQITNIDGMVATIRRRYWKIVDAVGRTHEVDGEGVVGHQPRLAQGQTFAYSSFCPIETPWGTMEGHFELESDDGHWFDVAVGRFYLVGPGR